MSCSGKVADGWCCELIGIDDESWIDLTSVFYSTTELPQKAPFSLKLAQLINLSSLVIFSIFFQQSEIVLVFLMLFANWEINFGWSLTPRSLTPRYALTPRALILVPCPLIPCPVIPRRWHLASPRLAVGTARSFLPLTYRCTRVSAPRIGTSLGIAATSP